MNFTLDWCRLTLARFNLRFHKRHFSRKARSCVSRLVFTSCSLLPNPAIRKVICYHFHSFQVLHEFMHSALPYLWRWTDAKWHPIPSITPEWCIERGFVTRFSVKMLLPETIGELLCFWKAGCNFLNCGQLPVLSTDGFVQIARVELASDLPVCRQVNRKTYINRVTFPCRMLVLPRASIRWRQTKLADLIIFLQSYSNMQERI